MKNEGRTLRVSVAFSPDELAGLESWMIEKRMLRGRSEAIRQLMSQALAASAAKPSAKSQQQQKRKGGDPS